MCEHLSLDRRRCHELYGKQGEDCLVEELTEKRCLSHQHCPAEASQYYCRPGRAKALCASWAENFAFASTLEHQHHADATSRVNASRNLRSECRETVLNLAKCMQRNYKSREMEQAQLECDSKNKGR